MGVGDTVGLTTVTANNLPAVPLSSISFTINGFATATASIQMYLANANSGVPNRVGLTNVDAFIGQTFEVAGSGAWNVVSCIGPLSATHFASGSMATNLGPVVISTFTAPTTFTATLGGSAVPKPSTLVMLGLGLCVGVVARRRK